MPLHTTPVVAWSGIGILSWYQPGHWQRRAALFDHASFHTS